MNIYNREENIWKLLRFRTSTKIDTESEKFMVFVGCVGFLLEVVDVPEPGPDLFVPFPIGTLVMDGITELDGVDIVEGGAEDDVDVEGVTVIFAFSAALIASDCAHHDFALACSVGSCNCS